MCSEKELLMRQASQYEQWTQVQWLLCGPNQSTISWTHSCSSKRLEMLPGCRMPHEEQLLTKDAEATLQTDQDGKVHPKSPTEAIVRALACCTPKAKEGLAWNAQPLLRVKTICWKAHVFLFVWELKAISKLFLPALQLRPKEAATNISSTELLETRHIHITRGLVVAIHTEDAVHVSGTTQDEDKEEAHDQNVGQGQSPIPPYSLAVFSSQAPSIASSYQLSRHNYECHRAVVVVPLLGPLVSWNVYVFGIVDNMEGLGPKNMQRYSIEGDEHHDMQEDVADGATFK